MSRSLGAESAETCELLHARKQNFSKDFDMHTPNVRAAAHALGGDIIGHDQALCPGPGHSLRDRSLAVRFVADGFIVHSHANDDWQTCREHVSARLGWDNQRPVTKPARMRATPQPPDDTVDRIGWARGASSDRPSRSISTTQSTKGWQSPKGSKTSCASLEHAVDVLRQKGRKPAENTPAPVGKSSQARHR
jgi:hypothetical protein